jgi:hypothetical protein
MFYTPQNVSSEKPGRTVPRTSKRFAWWLQPRGANPGRIAVAGAALVVGLMVPAFWRLF